MKLKSQERFKLQVCTTISPDYRKFLFEKNIPVSSALARGVRAFMNNETEKTTEIDMLRENIARLQTHITRLTQENAELVAQLEALKSQAGG